MIKFYIVGIVYILSIFIFRYLVKKRINEGYQINLREALFFVFMPILNTILICVWLLLSINITVIAKKFFK